MATTTEDASPNNSSKGSTNQLHDLFSIAEMQAALSTFNSSNVNRDTSFGIRLPFLLRCLAALQARSDITPSLSADSLSSKKSSLHMNTIAMLLEDVAAAHSGAENVELLLALAPSLCNDTIDNTIDKSIGKMPPLSRVKSSRYYDGSGSDASYSRWDTRGLSAVLEHLSCFDTIMNKRGAHEEQLPKKRQKFEDDSDDSDGGIIPPAWSSSAPRTEGSEVDTKSTYVNHYTTVNANDSYESAMRRTLQELVFLVKTSLDTETSLIGEDREDEHKPMVNGNSFRKETLTTPGLSVKSESLFAETFSASSAFGGDCSSLSVMVVILMHYAPVLRYDHVATALCRAAVPQASTLIQHMATNCPASVPCLLKGIIGAYDMAVRCNSVSPTAMSTDDVDPLGSGAQVSDILNTSVDSIKGLASLSKSEAFNVIHTLRRYNIMDELVLEMLMEHDAVAGASLIVEKLSACCGSVDSASNVLKCRSLRRQSSSSIEQQPRTVPLRQRMLGGRRQFTDVKLTQQIEYSQTGKQSNLVAAFRGNSPLVEPCMQCMSDKISSLTLSNKCAGEAALFLRAFAAMVHCAGSCHCDSASKILGCIPNLFAETNTSTDIPECSSFDDIYKLAICLVVLIWAKLSHTKDDVMKDSDGTTLVNKCKECLEHILAYGILSLECIVFSSRLAGFVIGNEASGMMTMILNHVHLGKYSVEPLKAEEVVATLRDVPSIKEHFERITKSALTLKIMVYDPVVIVEAIRRCGASQCTFLDELVKDLLSDPRSCRDILYKPMACNLIQESVTMLSKRGGPRIPLVLPFSLERKAMSIFWSPFNTIESQELCSQFVMQLLYALTFLREVPASPFVINPRSFPLKEVMTFVTSDSGHKIGDGALATALEKLISMYCPDIIQHIGNSKLFDGLSDFGVQDVPPSALYEAIQDSLQDSSKDPSGMRAEKLYLMCCSQLTTDLLVTTVCSAVLVSKHSQQKYFNYLHLCKDPLVIFKASVNAWKCHGVRKLVLKTLCHLLEANEIVAMQSSKTPQVATEFLASRNTIVLRCFLFTQTNICSVHCVASANLIRTIISKSPGIMATLLKQGVADVTVHYLCENIPESFSDAALLSNILSQKETFSIPERLMLANASLRIAIAHYSRGEAAARALVNSSMSVLIDSFQFVLGPVGVPVSVLRGHADVPDTTYLCRTALFGMIDALSTVNPDCILKDPCVIAIGRIASMCKSESIAVGSGAVGARRKALLKEVWDACSVVNTALGAEIQL